MSWEDDREGPGKDPELRICRRYGCRHEARSHGFIDGHPVCWKCQSPRNRHEFQAAGDERRKR